MRRLAIIFIITLSFTSVCYILCDIPTHKQKAKSFCNDLHLYLFVLQCADFGSAAVLSEEGRKPDYE
jgi:hypothetical protein